MGELKPLTLSKSLFIDRLMRSGGGGERGRNGVHFECKGFHAMTCRFLSILHLCQLT